MAEHKKARIALVAVGRMGANMALRRATSACGLIAQHDEEVPLLQKLLGKGVRREPIRKHEPLRYGGEFA